MAMSEFGYGGSSCAGCSVSSEQHVTIREFVFIVLGVAAVAVGRHMVGPEFVMAYVVAIGAFGLLATIAREHTACRVRSLRAHPQGACSYGFGVYSHPADGSVDREAE